MRKKPETAATLRGILANVTASINASRDGATVVMHLATAHRIAKALREHIRTESILTEPENHA